MLNIVSCITSIPRRYNGSMPIKRTYAEMGDACATAHAMELIAEHWSYIVIRELFLGAKRFSELLDSARGITPAVLTTRLRELEVRGLIESKQLGAPARVNVYDLTSWGHELEPIMRELGRWALRSPGLPRDGGLTPDAAILAMRTMAPDRPLDPPLRLQVRLSDGRSRREISYTYAISWDMQGFSADRGEFSNPLTAIEANATMWADAIFNGADLPPEAVSGDAAQLARLREAMTGALAVRSRPETKVDDDEESVREGEHL